MSLKMSNTSKILECEWSQNDKRAYCENIHNCIHEEETVTDSFKEYCIDTRNPVDVQNECTTFEFRCKSEPFDNNHSKTNNNSNDVIQVVQKETLSKCFCHSIFFRKKPTIHMINCRCFDYEKDTPVKNTNNKKNRKLKRVTARNCIAWPNKEINKKPQYACCVTEACIPSCFDSQFQCNSNLYLPTPIEQTTSSPMTFSSQGIFASLGIERFAGQMAFVLLYVPLIFFLACIIQKCSEIRNVKLDLDMLKMKCPETLKKTVHKMKELCTKKKEPKEQNSTTEEKS